MEFPEALAKLTKDITEARLRHTLGVLEWAEKMANKFEIDKDGINLEQVRWAALLHDCAKHLSEQELLTRAEQAGLTLETETLEQLFLLHAPIGALLAKNDYQITDRLILQAIASHTLGNEQMTVLDKIIFLADMVELNRIYPGVEEIRAMSLEDLDCAMICALDSTIKHLLHLGAIIHPQTIKTRNTLLINTGREINCPSML